MRYYFILQYKRFYRFIDEFGLPPLIGFPLLGFIFYLLSDLFFDKIEYAEYFYPLTILVLISKLSFHNRTDLLIIIFDKISLKKIRLIENLIYTLPFFTFLLWKQELVIATALLVITIIMSQFKKLNSPKFIIPTPFNKEPFEYIIGFRNYFWVFLLAYLLTYISITVNNLNLGIFSILIIYFISLAFYSKQEPVYYVWIFSLSPKDFLINKMKTASLFSLIISLPIIITLLIFFPIREILLILISMLFGQLLLIASILGKYSNYPSKISVNQGIAISVSLLFPPILLIIIPHFYSLSIQKLKNILA